MSIVEIDFGPNPTPVLARNGVKLPSVRGAFKLDSDSWFEAPCAVHPILSPGELYQFGAYCSLAGGRIGNVRVGRYASVGPDVVMGAHEHPTDWLTVSRLTYYPQMHDWHLFNAGPEGEALVRKRRPFSGSCPVTEIGNDVWIGQGSYIRAGVRIGDGAIVAARSVVVKDVEPYTVVAGSPAKAKKLRFPEKTVERLLAARWWRYNLYDLLGIEFENPERALDAIEARVAKGELAEFQPRRLTPFDLQEIVRQKAAA